MLKSSMTPSCLTTTILSPRYFRFPSLPLKRNKTLNLGGDLGLGVGDLDAELLGAGNNVDALAGGDGAGDPVWKWC